MYEKINTFILKNEMKRKDHRKHERIVCQLASDDFVLVCINGHRLHRIYKEYFMLDLEKLDINDNLEKIYQECYNSNKMDVYPVYTVDTTDNGKLVAFKDRADNLYFYREAFLKEYGKINDLYLIVNPEKPFSPAVIVDLKNRSMETGIICPVNYRG